MLSTGRLHRYFRHIVAQPDPQKWPPIQFIEMYIESEKNAEHFKSVLYKQSVKKSTDLKRVNEVFAGIAEKVFSLGTSHLILAVKILCFLKNYNKMYQQFVDRSILDQLQVINQTIEASVAWQIVEHSFQSLPSDNETFITLVGFLNYVDLDMVVLTMYNVYMAKFTQANYQLPVSCSQMFVYAGKNLVHSFASATYTIQHFMLASKCYDRAAQFIPHAIVDHSNVYATCVHNSYWSHVMAIIMNYILQTDPEEQTKAFRFLEDNLEAVRESLTLKKTVFMLIKMLMLHWSLDKVKEAFLPLKVIDESIWEYTMQNLK
jgi:hypothetical protein